MLIVIPLWVHLVLGALWIVLLWFYELRSDAPDWLSVWLNSLVLVCAPVCFVLILLILYLPLLNLLARLH